MTGSDRPAERPGTGGTIEAGENEPHAAGHTLLALQRSAGNRAAALVAGREPVVQRDAKTAAQALWDAKSTGVFVKDLTPTFNATHGVTRADQAAVKRVRGDQAGQRDAGEGDGHGHQDELTTATTGNSGGESYHPSGASVPHMSVEGDAPTAKAGLYKMKKFHDEVRSDGGYFWWSCIAAAERASVTPRGCRRPRRPLTRRRRTPRRPGCPGS